MKISLDIRPCVLQSVSDDVEIAMVIKDLATV